MSVLLPEWVRLITSQAVSRTETKEPLKNRAAKCEKNILRKPACFEEIAQSQEKSLGITT